MPQMNHFRVEKQQKPLDASDGIRKRTADTSERSPNGQHQPISVLVVRLYTKLCSVGGSNASSQCFRLYLRGGEGFCMELVKQCSTIYWYALLP